MKYNFLKDVKSIKNSNLCLYDSLSGYTSAFNINGDVDGWTIYNNIYLYGSWKGVLFGTSKSNSCYISRPDPVIPIEAENFHVLKVMMKVIPKDADLRPEKSKLSWTTLNDSVWSDSKSEEFDLVQDDDWHLYVINLGPNPYWQGDISNFRFYPILHSKNGDRFIVQSFKVESNNTYKCTNVDCSYYSNYIHNCPGAGAKGYIESGYNQPYISTISGVNDSLEVNIDGYGIERINLGDNNNVHIKNITKQMSIQLSRIGVGAYEYSEIDYDTGNRIKITSGNRSSSSSVRVVGGTAMEVLGFVDSSGNDVSTYEDGADPSTGFDYYGSRRFSYFEINNFIDNDIDAIAYSHNPEGFNVEIGRQDFENSTTSNSMAGVTTTTEATKKLFNNNSTIIDVSHPANNNGRLKTIYINGAVDTGQSAKIYIFRPYKDGTLKLMVTYDIPTENDAYIYTTEHITYKVDCNFFINKGDLIGAYNISISAPFSTVSNKPNATYYQFTGQPGSGNFSPGNLHSHGIMGFNLYGKSSRRTTNLSLDIDIGEVTNIETLSVNGKGLTDNFEYNIASCLDLNYQVDLYGQSHTHLIGNYYAIDVRTEYHTNIAYGTECLSDMITSADNGRLGDGWGNNSDGVYTTGHHAYFYVNGDAEWLHNDANYHYQSIDPKYEYSWSDVSAVTVDYRYDPISFMLIFPEDYQTEIHKTQVYFKDKRNFKSMTLAYYTGAGSEVGNGPRDHFSLVPEYQSVTVDGVEYNKYNMTDSLFEDVSPLLFNNPTQVIEPKFVNDENTNQSEVLTDYKLNWNIITHKFDPIDCSGFMIHTDYHESTKITEMEVYSKFYVSPSMADKVYIRYSRYGDNWTSLGFNTLDDDSIIESPITSAVRYINLDINSHSPLEINELYLYNSYDIKLEDCDTSVLLSNTKKGSLSDVTVLEVENVYDKTYDLTVDLPRDVTNDIGWLSWLTLENQQSLDLPNVGAGAILNKKEDYPIRNYNQQLANNCDTFGLDNIAGGKPIYAKLDGAEWTYLLNYDTTTSLDIHNNILTKETVLDIGASSSTTFTDSSPTPHTITSYNNTAHTTSTNVLGTNSAIEFMAYTNLDTVFYPTQFMRFEGNITPDFSYLEVEPSIDWDMGTSPCTIEFFFNLKTYNESYIARCWDSTDDTFLGNWYFHIDATGRMSFKTNGSTDTEELLPQIFSAGTWYHLAATSDGTLFKVYINGLLAAQKTLIGPFGNSTEPIIFGSEPITWGSIYVYTSAFNGYMSEIRVLKGVESSTVPVAPYTITAPDIHTKLLIHSDAQVIGAQAKYWKIQHREIENFDIDYIRAYYMGQPVPIDTVFLNSDRDNKAQVDSYSYLDSGYNKGVECLPSLLTSNSGVPQTINWVQSSTNTSNSYMLNTENTLSVGSYGSTLYSGDTNDYHGPVVSTVLGTIIDFEFSPKIYIDLINSSAICEDTYIDFIFKNNTDQVLKLRIRYNNNTDKYDIELFNGAFSTIKLSNTYVDAYFNLNIVKEGTSLIIADFVDYNNANFFSSASEEINSLEIHFMSTTEAQSEVKPYVVFAEKIKIIKPNTPFPGDYKDCFGLGFNSNTNIDKIVLRHTGDISSNRFDIYTSQFNVDDYSYLLTTEDALVSTSCDLDISMDLTIQRHLDIVRSYGANTNNIFMNKQNQVAYSNTDSSNPSTVSWNSIKPTLLIQVDSGTIVDNSSDPYTDISDYDLGSPVTIDNTFSAYPSGSSIYFNGTAAQLIKYKSTNIYVENLMLTSKDFTIAWWEYRQNGGNIFKTSETLSNPPGWSIVTTYWYYENDDLGSLLFGDGVETHLIAPYTLNEWTHYAVTRKAGKLFTFKNGKLFTVQDCLTNINVDTNYTTFDLTVEQHCTLGNGIGNRFYKGWLDDFMVIQGTALWTDDFTLPTEPYTYTSSDYTDTRWLKFQLTNGMERKQSITKLGIYPDIATSIATNGGYNCSWTNFGNILTNYSLFSTNLCPSATVSGSSSATLSGTMYEIAQFPPVNAIDGEIFPYTFDKCWGWSADDTLPTLDITFDSVNTINKIKMYHGPGQNTDYICEDYNISVYDPNKYSTTYGQTDYSAIFLHYDSIDVVALNNIGITVISGAPDDYTILYGQKQDLVQLFNAPTDNMPTSLVDALGSTGYITNPINIKTPFYTKIDVTTATSNVWFWQECYYQRDFNSLRKVYLSVRMNHWKRYDDRYFSSIIKDNTNSYTLIDNPYNGTDHSLSGDTELPTDWTDSVVYTADLQQMGFYINYAGVNISYWLSDNSISHTIYGDWYVGVTTYQEEISIASQELKSYLDDYLVANSLPLITDYQGFKDFVNIVSVVGNTEEITTHTFDDVAAETVRLEVTKYKSSGKSITSAYATVDTSLDGGFLREIEVYNTTEDVELDTDDYPIIATNLKDNFNVTNIEVINTHYSYYQGVESPLYLWDTSFDNLYYSSDFLSDPKKITFRQNIGGKIIYYTSEGLSYYTTAGDNNVSNLLEFVFNTHVYLDSGTYTLEWQAYNNIRSNLISIDIEGANQSFRLFGDYINSGWTTQSTIFTISDANTYIVRANIDTDEADTWGAKSVLISKTLEESRWLVIKNNYAENYDHNNIDENKGTNYISKLLVYGNEQYNPVEYHWWWTSGISTLENNGFMVKEAKRSLQINYPTSSGSDYIEFLQADDFGQDIYWSEMDLLEFWWYIDDINKLDLTYGGFAFGSFNPIGTVGFYMWDIEDLSLVTGWNKLSLSFNTPSEVYPLPMASRIDREQESNLQQNILRSFGLVYRGVGQALTMNLDSITIRRNRFDTEVTNGYKGLCLTGDESLNIPVSGLDLSKGSIEFWLKPYYDHQGYDVFNDTKSKTLFTLTNNSNDLVSLGVRSMSWFEIGVGNSYDNYKAVFAPDSSVFSDEVLFDYMEPVHVAMSWSSNGSAMANGNTIRLYINGELTIASSDTWDVTAGNQGAVLKLGGGNTTLAMNNDSEGSGIFYNLKIYNYCKDSFDINKAEDDLITYNPADFIELSKDGVEFYNNKDGVLPFIFPDVPVGEKRNIYVRANKDDKFSKSRSKTAEMMIQWITTV